MATTVAPIVTVRRLSAGRTTLFIGAAAAALVGFAAYAASGIETGFP